MTHHRTNSMNARTGWGKRSARAAGMRAAGAAILALLLLALALQPVSALAYFFQVTRETVDIYINTDGTASIDYVYDFQNQPNGDPIEYVDIGLPSTSFDINSVTGTVDGQPVSVEKNSSVNGISLNLGSRAIPPGKSGEVVARIGTINRLLFKADNNKTGKSEPYGSFQFNPNYFGSQYVTGKTDMTVTIHLPPGLKTEEPIYFPPKGWPGESQQPQSGFDSQNRVYYSWHATNASVSDTYTFGAAFPARLVPSGALLTSTPNINFDFNALCPWLFCLGFVGFLGFTIYGSIVGDKKRKLQYLPPRVSVEGNGIKRGLTAVEAAILMQQPMDKILTMILFSVVKKGAVTVVSRDPMKIEVVKPAPEGMDLRPYEQQFIDAMAQPDKRGQRTGLQNMMTDLVKSISEKMRGFSRRDTVAYYQDIMKKAWAQVEQANTPEMKMQTYDDAMDWTMLDRNWDTRTRETFGPRPVFLPMWWGRFDPGFGRGAVGGAGNVSTPSVSLGGNRPPTGASLPNLPGADFAGSLVGGMQAFSAGVVGDLTAFTGGVTSKTNPPPPPPTRSSGGNIGGGSGHCACACACACAGCACACAGGGR